MNSFSGWLILGNIQRTHTEPREQIHQVLEHKHLVSCLRGKCLPSAERVGEGLYLACFNYQRMMYWSFLNHPEAQKLGINIRPDSLAFLFTYFKLKKNFFCNIYYLMWGKAITSWCFWVFSTCNITYPLCKQRWHA